MPIHRREGDQPPTAFPCSVEFTRIAKPRELSWQELPLRRRIAWWLRLLADRIEGGGGASYTIQGSVPKGTSTEDWWDAIMHSAAAMQDYISDLALDRAVELSDYDHGAHLDRRDTP